MMAEAAVYNIERGAQIIDINMGCPAKKVCNKWAGSALMQDEPLACPSCKLWSMLRSLTTCPSH
jgi:tRNA-dihydrouridine synthase